MPPPANRMLPATTQPTGALTPSERAPAPGTRASGAYRDLTTEPYSIRVHPTVDPVRPKGTELARRPGTTPRTDLTPAGNRFHIYDPPASELVPPATEPSQRMLSAPPPVEEAGASAEPAPYHESATPAYERRPGQRLKYAMRRPVGGGKFETAPDGKIWVQDTITKRWTLHDLPSPRSIPPQ